MAEPLKALEADAKADPAGVTVTLSTDDGTVDVPMLHVSMWWEGAVEALTTGKISEWVHLACEDAAALQAWDSQRKRYRDLEAFVEAWSAASGENPGKSRSSASSSKSTRKR